MPNSKRRSSEETSLLLETLEGQALVPEPLLEKQRKLLDSLQDPQIFAGLQDVFNDPGSTISSIPGEPGSPPARSSAASPEAPSVQPSAGQSAQPSPMNPGPAQSPAESLASSLEQESPEPPVV